MQVEQTGFMFGPPQSDAYQAEPLEAMSSSEL